MIKDVESVRVIGDHKLSIRFEDGAEGEIDVARLVAFTGIMEPLSSPEYFARVEVNPDLGTVCWPNGADLDPAVLYSAATGRPLPTWSAELATARR